jgi:hypothetical protein
MLLPKWFFSPGVTGFDGCVGFNVALLGPWPLVLGPFKGGVNNARYALRKELSAHCMQFIWD